MEKSFTAFLMVNWKTGEMMIRKKEPESAPGYWVTIKFNLVLRIPDEEPQVTLSVDVPQAKVAEIVLEALGDDDSAEQAR